MDLGNELLCDRKWPTKAERARGDLQAWRGLLAFVLGAIYQQCDVADQFQIEAVMIGDLLWAPQVFDIGLENSVKNVVRRQAVLVLLVGTQLGRRCLLDGRRGNQ